MDGRATLKKKPVDLNLTGWTKEGDFNEIKSGGAGTSYRAVAYSKGKVKISFYSAQKEEKSWTDPVVTFATTDFNLADKLQRDFDQQASPRERLKYKSRIQNRDV